MRKDDKIKSTEQRTPPPPNLAFTSKKPQAGAEGATAGPPLTIHSTCKNQFPYSDSRPSSSTHPLNPLWKGACPTISLEFWKERPQRKNLRERGRVVIQHQFVVGFLRPAEDSSFPRSEFLLGVQVMDLDDLGIK